MPSFWLHEVADEITPHVLGGPIVVSPLRVPAAVNVNIFKGCSAHPSPSKRIFTAAPVRPTNIPLTGDFVAVSGFALRFCC